MLEDINKKDTAEKDITTHPMNFVNREGYIDQIHLNKDVGAVQRKKINQDLNNLRKFKLVRSKMKDYLDGTDRITRWSDNMLVEWNEAGGFKGLALFMSKSAEHRLFINALLYHVAGVVRKDITGPGNTSDKEQEMIKKAIGNSPALITLNTVKMLLKVTSDSMYASTSGTLKRHVNIEKTFKKKVGEKLSEREMDDTISQFMKSVKYEDE